MAKTKTSSAVKDRYNAKAYDEIKLRVYKGRKEELQTIAESSGDSLNSFIIGAVDERISRDSDDVYCAELYKEYQADPDKGEPVSVEDFAQSIGVTL